MAAPLPILSARAERIAIAAILGAALLLRLAMLTRPHAWFADEIFQYLEPAHRLVFGEGVVTWEYRYGIRNWPLPLLLAGPMALGGWIAPGTGAYLLGAKLLLVLVSLGSVAAAIALGRRLSPLHGIAAGLVVALWSETAYFATQALSEAVAIPAALGAAALLPERAGSRERLAGAGALLALAAVLRFQYTPALALFALVALGRDRRRWLWVAAGALAMLAASAALDAAMGQTPFAWLVANIRLNIVEGRSHLWVEGPGFYPRALLASWLTWAIPIVALAVMGARRFPALGLLALGVIAVHSGIAHKEYRYILLATTIIVLLAAIGTIDLAIAGRGRIPLPRGLAIAAAGWLAASALIGNTPFTAYYRAAETPKLEAFAALRTAPTLCGLALSGVHWGETGGYAYLHRAVPIYVPDERSGQAAPPLSTSAGYDTVLAPLTAPLVPPGYARTRCFGTADRFAERSAVCLWQRPGGCNPAAAAHYRIDRVLRRVDR